MMHLSLRSQIVWVQLSRGFHVSTFDSSKTSKRLKKRRLEHAPHLQASKRTKEKTNCDLCLDHFNDFYKKTFGEEWVSFRLALLSRSKYCALINNYSPVETTKARLQRMGCYSIKDVYNREVDRIKAASKPIEKTVETVANADFSVERPEPAKRQPVEEEEDATVRSMDPLTASERLISSDELLLHGGGPHLPASSVKMYEHVPPSKLIGLDDDWVEESEYYKGYDKGNIGR